MTRVLALLHLVPNPPHGGEQRVHHVLAALADTFELVVAALPRARDQTSDWPLAERFAEPAYYFRRSSHIAEDSSTGGIEDLFAARRRTWPRRVQSDYSAELWRYLERLDLSGFGTILVGAMSMIPYGLALKTRWPHVRLAIDFDYIDPRYAWRELFADPTRLLSRSGYWGVRNVIRLFRFCRKFLPAFDSVWVCSDTDQRWLKRWMPRVASSVVPNGIDCAAFADVRPSPATPRVIMAGSLMEGPNSDGAVWFANQIWPRVREAIPAAECWIVGRDPCASVRELAGRVPGVIVTGYVPDIRPFLSEAAISIAPIRYGTGTRLKILEATAAGLPVVSTRVGAEGLDFQDGNEIMLADRPQAFADACVRLLRDPALRARIAAAGRRAVRKYDWPAIYQVIQDLVRGDKK